MRLLFLGAARQVTGSCYLVEGGGLRVLVDCGAYQERHYLARNWEPPPVPPDSVDFLLLTHAHLDHSGLIPKFVRDGFSGRILTTGASRDLADIVLDDSARIQEEDAAFKRKRHEREGRRGPYPEVPLYSVGDVRKAMKQFESVPYAEAVRLNDRVHVTFRDAGHILGSAMLELAVGENGVGRTIVFSGDIGQWDKPIIRDPSVFERADYVVMESTYGGRDHEDRGTVRDQLCVVINAAVEAGGNVIIPTFAIERAQELMYEMAQLLQEDRIPHVLVFLDSPMAVDATEVFRKHQECMDEETLRLIQSGQRLFQFPGLQLVRHIHQSKAINRIHGSCVIMAGSGMCNAGRIKHHLAKNVSRPESTIVIAGYQASGTLGRELVNGAPQVRIHGKEHPVRANVTQIHGLSGHAGQSGLLKWLGHLKTPPRRLFLTHGEEDSLSQLGGRISARFGWKAEVPSYKAGYDLG